MKFSTRQDCDLSSEALFDRLADFDRIALLLTRRGVQVTRLESGKGGSAKAWELRVDWRGKPRIFSFELVQFDRPDYVKLKGASGNFDLTVEMSFIPRGREKSRLGLELDIRPRNMKARLMIQTAKLGKPALDKRFADWGGRFVQQMSELAMN